MPQMIRKKEKLTIRREINNGVIVTSFYSQIAFTELIFDNEISGIVPSYCCL